VKSIEDILKGIRPEFDFTTSQDFISDGMLDSFDVVTLVSELDRTYGISIEGIDILPENVQNLDAIRRINALRPRTCCSARRDPPTGGAHGGPTEGPPEP
jgi:acyl carrier protein